ncbi:uncharacterized protein LOC129263880 [Lytechinus pictus]|uniref:uncharacterized protein LOC129263880 n=1 Tax=Lytechinus pictus TaxID=7653 RepID=UPI0030B9D770
MAAEDFKKILEELNSRKALHFQDFIKGCEGGLDPQTLKAVGIDLIDIKYKTLKKGTKVYALMPLKAAPIHVYTMNIETLHNIIAENPQNDENGVSRVSVFELTSDSVMTMQIREDIACKVCSLWIKSKDKDNAAEETEGKDYKKLLQSRDPSNKNFIDLCITRYSFPEFIHALVYTRQNSAYEVLVTGCFDEFIRQRRFVQDVVLPKSSLSKLTVDEDGYLRLGSSSDEPTHVAVDVAYAKVKDKKVSKEFSQSQKVPSYDDNFPTAEEYNDHKEDDHSLDYESIDIKPLPTESMTNVPVASPRPDQKPPPPPTAEPVYSTIDKSAKKPRDRQKSVDQPDTPGTPTGTKPPRPPPLDTMPNSDGESPAQSHKPSRPSAPPRVLRGKSQSSLNSGHGSTGNVSLDGKDEALEPPPRTSMKVKGQKSDTMTRF